MYHLPDTFQTLSLVLSGRLSQLLSETGSATGVNLNQEMALRQVRTQNVQGVPDVFILGRMDILGDKTHVMN